LTGKAIIKRFWNVNHYSLKGIVLYDSSQSYEQENYEDAVKALQIIEANNAVWKDVNKPTVKTGYALIRPVVLSLCASDIYLWRYEDPSCYPLDLGTSGHEIIGVVEEVLDSEQKDCPVQVGTAALVITPEQNALAEYYLAPFKNILPLPTGISFDELVQAQQLGTVLFACKQLPSLIAKTVVVIGQGAAGQWFNTMCKRLGAARIIAIDLQAHRLAISTDFGATNTIHNLGQTPEITTQELLDITGGDFADVVIEAVGDESSINLSLDLVKEYGFILGFGVPHQLKFVFNYNELFRKNVRFQPCVFASREPEHASTRIALEMIASGAVDARPLITHRFPFEKVIDAYELQASKDEGALKILIDMPEKS